MLDTLIIGAGAAGLAAADHLRKAGKSALILEARDRIGGRIHTDTTFANYPLELGAEFIHGETAATWEYVRAFGMETIEVPRYAKLRWGMPARLIEDLPDAQRTLIRDLFDTYNRLPEYESTYADCDASLADYFRAKGFSGDALDIADVLFAQTCCARLEQLSCADFIREMKADHAGHRDFRLKDGYKPLLDQIAAPLDIRLNVIVRRIDWAASQVTVTAESGESFTARRCIITLPIGVLQRNTVQFDPPLSPHKRDAIRAYYLGAASKFVVKAARRAWDADLIFMAYTGDSVRWWTPGYGRGESADPLITLFVTADKADRFENFGDPTTALALANLNQMLGESVEVVSTKYVRWASDPFAWGGYASLPAGTAWARPALAEPESDRLFFAGESTAYETNPQTVHGAIESGWRAAREVIASL
ncbi:MAG: NAD(P)/FAD-dependent oxidoreductase [Anaerolineae bacterium]